MGATPSVTAVLVDATPYRLRYLCTSTNNIPGAAVLTNQDSLPAATGTIIGGVDLRTNARSAAEAGTLGLPLLRLLSTPVTDQAEARRLLLGEGGSPPNLVNTGLHCIASMQDRGATGGPPGAVDGQWLIDADEGAAAGAAASAGFAVLLITPPGQAIGEEGYLDIHFKRTYDQ